jgi:hypothetical protein
VGHCSAREGLRNVFERLRRSAVAKVVGIRANNTPQTNPTNNARNNRSKRDSGKC